jgi:hypothetical protein
MNIGRAVSTLTLFTIYFIPIIGFIDFLISIGVLPGSPGRDRPNHPFPNIIVAKEALALLIFLLLFIIVLKKLRVKRLSFLVVFVLGLFTTTSNDIYSIIAGMRQNIAFVYIPATVFTMYYYYNLNIDGRIKIINALKTILIIEFVFVLLQILFQPSNEGFTFLGPRTLGSFTNPNAIGVFASVSIILLLLLRKSKNEVPIIYYLITAFTCLSSGSRIAIFLFILTILSLMISISRNRIDKLISIIIAFLGLFVSIVFINNISSKPAGLSIVDGTRVTNIAKYILNNDSMTLLIGNGWGKHTSWYFALHDGNYTNSPNFVMLDSFYASILAQGGMLGLFIMMLFLSWLFSLGGKKGLYLFFIFCIISIQTNILEFYPIIFYIFIALGMLIFDLRQNRMLLSATHSRLK